MPCQLRVAFPNRLAPIASDPKDKTEFVTRPLYLEVTLKDTDWNKARPEQMGTGTSSVSSTSPCGGGGGGGGSSNLLFSPTSPCPPSSPRASLYLEHSHDERSPFDAERSFS